MARGGKRRQEEARGGKRRQEEARGGKRRQEEARGGERRQEEVGGGTDPHDSNLKVMCDIHPWPNARDAIAFEKRFN